MGKHRSKLEQQIEILLMLNQEDCLTIAGKDALARYDALRELI